jgi:hypothetical protein
MHSTDRMEVVGSFVDALEQGFGTVLAQSRPRSLNSQAAAHSIPCDLGARYCAVANVDLATLIQKLGDLSKIFMSVIGMKRQGKPLHAAESKAVNPRAQRHFDSH